MASAQDCHTLTTYYMSAHKSKNGKAPVVNRNKSRWNWDSMLYDMTVPEIMKLIDYYFTTVGPYDLNWFFYNYDELMLKWKQEIEDAQHRKRLREESEQRAAEWRERIGKSRT